MLVTGHSRAGHSSLIIHSLVTANLETEIKKLKTDSVVSEKMGIGGDGLSLFSTSPKS